MCALPRHRLTLRWAAWQEAGEASDWGVDGGDEGGDDDGEGGGGLFGALSDVMGWGQD